MDPNDKIKYKLKFTLKDLCESCWGRLKSEIPYGCPIEEKNYNYEKLCTCCEDCYSNCLEYSFKRG